MILRPKINPDDKVFQPKKPGTTVATPNQLPGSAPPPPTPQQPSAPNIQTPAPGTPNIQTPAPGTPNINLGNDVRKGPIFTAGPGGTPTQVGGTAMPTAMPLGGATAAPAGQPLSDFTPDQNLIGKQINPTTDPRLGQAQGAVDQYLQQMQNIPDREALAKQIFQNIEGSIADQRKLGIQDIGRSAAKFGRIGSGKVTTDLGNLENQLDINRNRALNDLSAGAAGAKLSDILGQLGAASGVEGQRFGQGSSERNELRGERQYQQGMSEQAKQDAINQAMAEQQHWQGQFGNQTSLADMLGGYGFGSGENYGPAMSLAQLLGGQATMGMQGLNNLFNQQAQNQQGQQGGGLSLQQLLGGLGSGIGKVGSWIGGLFK